MQINIQLKGDILKKLPSVSAFATQKLRDGVIKASTLLQEDSIRNAPSSTGTLRRSIRREIFGQGLSAVIFPSVDYAVKLHGDGSRQRSSPFTIPAREAQEGGTLYRWAKKKGMNPWAIRASIAKRGIRLNPWMYETSKQDEPKVEEIFKIALGEIASSMAD